MTKLSPLFDSRTSVSLSVCQFIIQKTLTWAITFEWYNIGLSYFTCIVLVTFLLAPKYMTLTVTFDLYFVNISLNHNFWTITDTDLIFHMYTYYLWKDLSSGAKSFNIDCDLLHFDVTIRWHSCSTEHTLFFVTFIFFIF